MPENLVIPHQTLFEAWVFTGTVADLKAMIKWAEEHGGERVVKDKEKNVVLLEKENYDFIINEGDWLIHTHEGIVKMTDEEMKHNYSTIAHT